MSNMKSNQKKSCPICKKKTSEDFFPFCSKGCKDVDLNRWLSGVYVIPGEPADQTSDTFDEV